MANRASDTVLMARVFADQMERRNPAHDQQCWQPCRPFVAIPLAVAVGYLLGSVTVAHRVARRCGVADLRKVGDHNPGYWNAKEQLGWRAALPLFVVDTGKGALAAGLGWLVADGQWWLPYLAGGAAMVGHAWPVLAGFAGGRSVLTFVGAALVFAPSAAIPAVGLFVLVWVVWRRFEWGARAGVASFPIFQIVIEGPSRTALTGALMTLIGLRFLQARWRGAPAARADRRTTTDRHGPERGEGQRNDPSAGAPGTTHNS